jgi:hypothetical protein
METSQIIPIMAAAIPTMITVLIGILINNSHLGDLREDMNTRFTELNTRFSDLKSYIDIRFDHVDDRFDHMEKQFDAKLRRVEEVMDARLKHLEER